MEIPVIERISDLQNPSFVSQVFAFSGIPNIYQAYSLCKWGALILALLASFTTIITRIKILILRFRTHTLLPSPSSSSLLSDYSDYDSETDDLSSSSLSDDEAEELDDEPSRSWRSIDEDFSVRGSGHYLDDQLQKRSFRRRNSSIGDLFSWSELTNGKNVVKLWDNLGLGFGLNLDEDDSGNTVSVYDIDRRQNVCSIFGRKSEVPAISASSSSQAVLVSAETNVSGYLLKVWDTRVGCRIPEILTEWRPRLGKIVGVNAGGVEKVYVRDDVTGSLTVGDMRKPGSPLVNVTESDVDTWWDADAVIVSDECVDDEVKS